MYLTSRWRPSTLHPRHAHLPQLLLSSPYLPHPKLLLAMAQPHKHTIASRRLQESRHPNNSALSMPANQRRARKWTKSEDELIISLRKKGTTWKAMAKQLPLRTGLACRLHYQNYLRCRLALDEKENNELNDRDRRAGTVTSILCISSSPDLRAVLDCSSASDMQRSSAEYALTESITDACGSSEIRRKEKVASCKERSVVIGRPGRGPQSAAVVPGSQAQGCHDVVLPSFRELDKTSWSLGLKENWSAWQRYKWEGEKQGDRREAGRGSFPNAETICKELERDDEEGNGLIASHLGNLSKHTDS